MVAAGQQPLFITETDTVERPGGDVGTVGNVVGRGIGGRVRVHALPGEVAGHDLRHLLARDVPVRLEAPVARAEDDALRRGPGHAGRVPLPHRNV